LVSAITDGRAQNNDGRPQNHNPLELLQRPGKLSRREKRAMMAQLLRMILEPSSSAESDDEIERPSAIAGYVCCVMLLILLSKHFVE